MDSSKITGGQVRLVISVMYSDYTMYTFTLKYYDKEKTRTKYNGFLKGTVIYPKDS